MEKTVFGGKIGDDWRTSEPWWPPVASPPDGAPNVMLVVLDDVGFAQLGCYGSDIETPVIDGVAAEGVRLTNFHTTALVFSDSSLPPHGSEPPSQRDGPRGRPGDRLPRVLGQATQGEWLPLRGPQRERVRHLCRREMASEPGGRDQYGRVARAPGPSHAGSTVGTGSTAGRRTNSSRRSTTTTTASGPRAPWRMGTT